MQMPHASCLHLSLDHPAGVRIPVQAGLDRRKAVGVVREFVTNGVIHYPGGDFRIFEH